MRRVLFLVALLAPVASADPLYYTFEGNIAWITASCSSADSAWVQAQRDAYGKEIGSRVTYTLLVDFERPGTVTWTPENVHIYQSNPYCDYVCGDLFLGFSGGYPMEWNVGGDTGVYDGQSGINASSTLHGGYGDNDIVICTDMQVGYSWLTEWERYKPLSDWTVGTLVLGCNSSCFLNYISTLTITRISETHPVPVPEPSTLVFVAMGLLGTFCLTRPVARRMRLSIQNRENVIVQ